MAVSLVETDCGLALLRLLSRGHAVVAELQRCAETLPAAIRGEGEVAKRLSPVLPDFAVFRREGAVEKVAGTPELIELDEESREINADPAERLFRVLSAIRKYFADLAKLLDDIDVGVFVGQSHESILRDSAGAVLLPEAIALLGTMILIVDERISGPCRERALVLFYRCTAGTSRESDDFADVCRLFKSTARPERDIELAGRRPGYPESYFARFPLHEDAVRLVLGKLQTGDIYEASRHYPLPEHRSHGLSAQAGMLYVLLFFQAKTLESDAIAMREIVDRHFGDVWVVAYALGYTADLLLMWAPYPAARQALSNAITAGTVRQLQEQHLDRLSKTRSKLEEYLVEGVLTEDYVSSKVSQLVSVLREANTSIRWLLLQPTTLDSKIQVVCNSSAKMKEQLLGTLVDTALLEDKIKAILVPLVARRDADWARLKEEAAQAMDDLAVFFSGQHALRRNVRNSELEEFFRSLQQRIEELSFQTQEDLLALGRKVGQINKALEEVALFHEVSQQPQILHFLSDARQLLQRMLRTASLSSDVLETIETVADLSYAWRALSTYKEAMGNLLAASPDSVKGLRALFLKLASILEAPLRRIRQAGNSSHASLVSGYYSSRLVEFMRSVLQEIPCLIFRLLGQLSTLESAQLPKSLPSRISLVELQSYAEKCEKASSEVGILTQRIALLMRGIRETDVALLGAVLVDPRAVLLDGLRREVARRIESLLASLSWPSPSSRQDAEAPLQQMAAQAFKLRRSFEHVQDYLGVSAQQLWRQEFGRVVRYLLHMEEHLLLRRRPAPPESSPHHDASVPIKFPDISNGPSGCSFISRTLSMLSELTDPKSTSGGFHHDWRKCDSSNGVATLDSLLLELLMEALGPPGIAAISRMLALRAAGRLRKAVSGCAVLLANAEVQQLATKAKSALQTTRPAAEVLRTSAGLLSTQVGPLGAALASVGQALLVRRRLAAQLRLHSSLDASLVSESVAVLDGNVLFEVLDDADETEVQDGELPSLWDFVGDGKGASPEETQLRFRRKLARMGELPGFADPLRQLMQVVPEGSAPSDMDMLMALALVQYTTSVSPAAASRKSQKRPTAWSGKVPSASPGGFRQEAHVSLGAGLAALLQQLPRRILQGTFQICGLYLQSMCSGDDNGQAWADGAVMIQILSNCLETGAQWKLLQLMLDDISDLSRRVLRDGTW
ncbi:washc5 [Symbiodinium sp. CCMP2592]|nr:washc5 [Symbiodinium sp. CCMP2592]